MASSFVDCVHPPGANLFQFNIYFTFMSKLFLYHKDFNHSSNEDRASFSLIFSRTPSYLPPDLVDTFRPRRLINEGYRRMNNRSIDL